MTISKTSEAILTKNSIIPILEKHPRTYVEKMEASKYNEGKKWSKQEKTADCSKESLEEW